MCFQLVFPNLSMQLLRVSSGHPYPSVLVWMRSIFHMLIYLPLASSLRAASEVMELLRGRAMLQEVRHCAWTLRVNSLAPLAHALLPGYGWRCNLSAFCFGCLLSCPPPTIMDSSSETVSPKKFSFSSCFWSWDFITATENSPIHYSPHHAESSPKVAPLGIIGSLNSYNVIADFSCFLRV